VSIVATKPVFARLVVVPLPKVELISCTPMMMSIVDGAIRVLLDWRERS
jgi:hypothetical protein